MSVWDDIAGQPDAVSLLQAAASRGQANTDANAMTHSWLFTGPPGSGRSNLAYAFAAALLCAEGGCGTCDSCRQVAARSHPDLSAFATDRVIISIEEVRGLLASSQYSPSLSRYRVMVIEDADRMTERTSNVLLKALEEPPPRTVWILCAPSEADLIPTIRSRVRSLRLRIPHPDDVAKLVARRTGVSEDLALRAAREAQGHIGIAHRLASDDNARARREDTLRLALAISSVPSAVNAASELVELAKTDAAAFTAERDASERESVLRSLGVEPGGTIPPALRAQIRQLEDDQKRRATRSLRDGIDRILTDLHSLFRDVMVAQLEGNQDFVNAALADPITSYATAHRIEDTIAVMDAITVARRRMEANVPPLLVMEALLLGIALGHESRRVA